MAEKNVHCIWLKRFTCNDIKPNAILNDVQAGEVCGVVQYGVQKHILYNKECALSEI